MYDPKLGKALSFSYLHTIQSQVLFMYFEKKRRKKCDVSTYKILILAQRMFTWKRCTIQYAAIWTFFLAYFSLPYFNIWGQMTYRPETFRCIITNFDADGNDQKFDRSDFL